MMSVKEYSEDINQSIEVIIKKAKELGYDVNNEDDILSEDAVIDLDTALTMNVQEEENDTVYIEEESDEKDYDLDEELDEKAENLASASNIKYDDSIKVQKLKKKTEVKEDINAKKKEMYKNKSKLKENEVKQDDSAILYKDGMTVSDLAESLGVPATEIIKKLMSLGVMASLNNSISFDDAEMVVIDYDKTLKNFDTQDKVNFEKLEISAEFGLSGRWALDRLLQGSNFMGFGHNYPNLLRACNQKDYDEIAGRTRAWNEAHPEERRELNKRAAQAWKDPYLRQEQRERILKHDIDHPERIEKISDFSKKMWDDAIEVRQAMSSFMLEQPDFVRVVMAKKIAGKPLNVLERRIAMTYYNNFWLKYPHLKECLSESAEKVRQEKHKENENENENIN